MTQDTLPAPAARATVEYEPPLVEEAVRFALDNGPSTLPGARLLRLRHQNRNRLDDLYLLPHGEDRESAFREHYWQLFRALELDQVLAAWLDAFPCLSTDLEYILVRSVGNREDEGAELWENRERQGQGIPAYLVIAARPCDLSLPVELGKRLLASLQQAADRVRSPNVANLGASADRQVDEAKTNTRCPLCRFPTTDWAAHDLVAEITPSIRRDFPGWLATEGCCGHCAERYLSLIDPALAPSPY